MIATFGHKNIAEVFKLKDGSPARPFASVEEMDTAMIEGWNSVVGPKDLVYHLGDVVINRKFLPVFDKLNGRKKLIMGNHDLFDTKDYLKYFEKVLSTHKLGDYILTHIPIREDQIPKWCKGVLHGHIHNQLIPQVQYVNCCVEWTDYVPINIEDIENFRIEQQKSFTRFMEN